MIEAIIGGAIDTAEPDGPSSAREAAALTVV
jgi:hypothetical protein